MKKAFLFTFLMALIWSGAEGQDPDVFPADFEAADSDFEGSVKKGKRDKPPVVKIIAPVSGDCDLYTDKASCNEQFLCRWSKREDRCVAKHR